ncbi:hypothetical protein [Endozoicomonas numazuensis]|uniref:hypothetical protein n=1 Tax=Endozoicomonas numazuensis TaxID=1137799 RepID=UPI001267DF59|nr:hypothetical protein [Endozoicomonas numazuensis]
MKRLKLITFIVLCVALYLYIVFFRCIVPSALINLTDGIVTTFSSTLLSIIVGIFLFEKQRKSNDKSELQRLKLITIAESNDIKSILSDSEGMTLNLPENKKIEVIVTFLSPLAHEEAGKSGLFDALTTENLFHISRKIRMYNLKVGHLLGLMRNKSDLDFIEHAAKNVSETKDAILYDCELVSSQVSAA